MFQPKSGETVRVEFFARGNGCTAEVVSFAGKHLHVRLAHAVAPGEAATVLHDDTLALSEVICCSPQEDGWSVLVEVKQILAGIAALEAHVQRVWRG